MSKLFEKLLKRLQVDTNINELIPSHQFGFREKHSTTQQCQRTVHEILKCLEEKKLCTAAFLDIQQAFDRVWHDGLLDKRKTTLPTPYYLILKSYLTERYSQIQFNASNSKVFPIHSGVPQGSHWAPYYTSFSQPISPPDMTPSSPHSQMTLPYWLVIQIRTSQPKVSNNTLISSLFSFEPGGSWLTRLNQPK